MGKDYCSQCGKELLSGELQRCVYCDLNHQYTSQVKNNVKVPNVHHVYEVHNSQASAAAESTNCGKCNLLTIRDNRSLHCGLCKKWFHNTCNEFALDDRYCSLIYEAPKNIKWFCDKCIWETEKWIDSETIKDEDDDVISIDKRDVSRKKQTKKEKRKKTKTSDGNSFVCNKCGCQLKTFFFNGSKKPMKCEDCGTGSKPKQNLRTEKIVHNKPGNNFASKERIEKHAKKIHSGDKPYECEICGNNFKTKHFLKVHQHPVLGNCNETNTQKQAIKHVQKVHQPPVFVTSNETNTQKQAIKFVQQKVHQHPVLGTCNETNTQKQAINFVQQKVHQHPVLGTCNETNIQKQAIRFVQKSQPPTQSIASGSNTNSNDSSHYIQYNQQPQQPQPPAPHPPLMVYTGGNNELRAPVYSSSHVTATIHGPPPAFSLYQGHYMG